MRTPKSTTALSAVTSTTTSSAIDVREAKKITFLFTRAAHSAGSSTFTVTGCIEDDATTGTFVELNTLIDNVTNTNAQTLTRVASSALSSNTSKVYCLDVDNFSFNFIKITGTIATDGNATCKVLVEY